VPDGLRPVFCKECLVKFREEKNSEIDTRKTIKLEELKKLAAEKPIKEMSLKSIINEINLSKQTNFSSDDNSEQKDSLDNLTEDKPVILK
jgi:hypothetical protein